MQLNIQTPRKFLNPLLSQKSVVSTDVDAFKAALGKYVQDVKQQLSEKQSEPNIVTGGSGHFLVSALNEILYIKSLLGLLVDEAGNMLDYSISIENDELIVTSDNGELFEYKKGSPAKTLVQKTLFQEKQKIIENCLFGVDSQKDQVLNGGR